MGKWKMRCIRLFKFLALRIRQYYAALSARHDDVEKQKFKADVNLWKEQEKLVWGVGVISDDVAENALRLAYCDTASHRISLRHHIFNQREINRSCFWRSLLKISIFSTTLFGYVINLR